jgi:hypothetical protein
VPTDASAYLLGLIAAIVFAVSAALLARTVLRLRTAFRERLGRLPGAPLWRRAKHRARFWWGIGVHLAWAAALAVAALISGRFLLRYVVSLG